MTEELKPCPFCQGEADLVQQTSTMYNVVCGCGAEGPMSHGAEAARAGWNRRAAPSQPEGAPTGWPPGMLQDDDRKLSRALANTPHARAHADEAAAAIRPVPWPADEPVAEVENWEARTVLRFNLRPLPAGTLLYLHPSQSAGAAAPYEKYLADQAALIDLDRLAHWLMKYGIATADSREILGARVGEYVNNLIRREPFPRAGAAAPDEGETVSHTEDANPTEVADFFRSIFPAEPVAPREPRRITVLPGDEMHLTILGVPYGFNFLMGKDRQDMLAYGRAVWTAALSAPKGEEPSHG